MKPLEKSSRPPSIDQILKDNTIHKFSEQYGRNQVIKTIRETLENWRKNYGERDTPSFCFTKFVIDLEQQLKTEKDFSLRCVFNLSGIVLHTNLGRALLPQSAIDTIIKVAGSATNLEYDLNTGSRGDRDDHIETLICELTGAEAATVVNNNAAALLLTLNSLSLGREVPISRGELVEIGGSFRIPEIMMRAGCLLREVGATNRTHASDYENAVNQQTALLMKVYTSNFSLSVIKLLIFQL